MAKGKYLTIDGLVMVEYGKRQGAISPAQYKANGYRPVYEALEQELIRSARGLQKSPPAKNQLQSGRRSQNAEIGPLTLPRGASARPASGN